MGGGDRLVDILFGRMVIGFELGSGRGSNIFQFGGGGVNGNTYLNLRWRMGFKSSSL